MAASRENYDLILLIKHKQYKRVWKIIKLIFKIRKKKYEKGDLHLTIKDTFSKRFYKLIGCKFFNHRWRCLKDEYYYDKNHPENSKVSTAYFCDRCYKWEWEHEHKAKQREDKISKII